MLTNFLYVCSEVLHKLVLTMKGQVIPHQNRLLQGGDKVTLNSLAKHLYILELTVIVALQKIKKQDKKYDLESL